MADNFKNFRVYIDLHSEAAQAYALDVAHKAKLSQHHIDDDDDDVPLPADFPPGLRAMVEEWNFETEAVGQHGIRLHSTYGGEDSACAFIQHLLQRFEPTGHVGFEYSRNSIPEHDDSYGGGAAFVTADEIRIMRTSLWLAEQIAQLDASRRPAP
jgi:hypothetical protein